MKRNLAIVVTVVAVVVVGLALSSRQARADGAVVISAQGCIVFDASCSTLVFATDAEIRFVLNPNGNSKGQCEGTLPAGAVLPTDGAVHCDGFACFDGIGTTNDSRETISPSGQFTIQCFNH